MAAQSMCEKAAYPFADLGMRRIDSPCGRGETGRRIGLKLLSALGETRGAELLKVGETLTGNPEPSPSPERKV